MHQQSLSDAVHREHHNQLLLLLLLRHIAQPLLLSPLLMLVD
jgi:hypothetical protein